MQKKTEPTSPHEMIDLAKVQKNSILRPSWSHGSYQSQEPRFPHPPPLVQENKVQPTQNEDCLHQSAVAKKREDAIDKQNAKKRGRVRGTLLPADFRPSRYSVMIGRSKECKSAIGNQRLRVLAITMLPKYEKAQFKMEKTLVVSSLVDTVREACPNGGAFIQPAKGGRWIEMDDAAAREKVGYVIRDLLHDQYRSSSQSRRKIRKHDMNDSESSLETALSEISKNTIGEVSATSEDDDRSVASMRKLTSQLSIFSPRSNTGEQDSQPYVVAGEKSKEEKKGTVHSNKRAAVEEVDPLLAFFDDDDDDDEEESMQLTNAMETTKVEAVKVASGHGLREEKKKEKSSSRQKKVEPQEFFDESMDFQELMRGPLL